MSLARFHGVAFVVDSDGETVVIAPLASVAVRREDTGALASLFSDRAGAVGIANPITADSQGRFAFHAAGLADGYRITVTEAGSPGTEFSYRYMPAGNFMELDNPITTKGDLITGGSTGLLARHGVGSDGYPLVPVSGASDGLAYVPPGLGYNLVGGYLDWSAAGSPAGTLLVSIKTWAGNDPSASEPVFIAFRSSTAGASSLTYRKITAATSITINDTALMGTVGSIAFRLWAVAFDDGGTIRLALINCLSSSAGAGSGRNVTAIYPLSGWGIASSTLEDNASDSAQVFYSSGAAVTSQAYATLGYATWEAGLVNAGNWNSNPTRIQLWGPTVPLPGQVIQIVRTDNGSSSTGTTTVPHDNTIPQITEGDQYMTQAITPSSAANALEVEAQVVIGNNSSSAGYQTTSLFQDAVANALKTAVDMLIAAGYEWTTALSHLMLASTTSSTTFRTRSGNNQTGTTTISGSYGGVANSYMQVREIMG